MHSTHQSSYGWLMLAGIVVSIVWWSRLAKRDERLVFIYVAALVGAFLGAKLAYLAAEGWLHWNDPHRWLILATGKSITGALLGGYAAVEAAKHFLHYRRTTGDWFALVAPAGIMLGRIGCILHGCCLGRACAPAWYTWSDTAGVARWPAALVELLFNAFMLALVLWFRRRKLFPGQHFHIYLVAYGLFRFLHEFLRETPRILGPLSGYQVVALLVAALGLAGFILRKRQQPSDEPYVRPYPATQ